MNITSLIRSCTIRLRGERALAMDEDWPPGAVMSLVRLGLGMALRGAALRPRCGSASGLLLVGRGTSLRNVRHLHCGRNVIIEDYVEIQALSRRGIRLGNNVSFGRYTVVRPTGNYGGGIGEGMIVDQGTSFGPFCFIGCSGYMRFGRNVMVGPRVSFFGENHIFEAIDRPIRDQGVRKGPITVEDNVWIGSHAVILPGVRIGTGAIIASGAVVNRDVEPYAIVGGIPARLLKYRTGWQPPP